jgi:hypothetical protein
MGQRLVFTCLFSVFLLAQGQLCPGKEDGLGHISFRSGDVTVRGAKETVWNRAELHMPVYFGDNIRTGEDGAVTITYVDGSLIKIRPNTHIALNAIVSPVERKSSVLLYFGRIWNKVRKGILQVRGFEVQTPTAVVGVRGSEFDTASYEDGTTIVLVDSGMVTVDNEANRSTLSTNEGAQLSFDTREIKKEYGFKPAWERIEEDARKNLFADGKKYGGLVRGEIHKRRDHVKGLIAKATDLSAERERYLSRAKDARERGDEIGFESSMTKAKGINEELRGLNRKIAFYGRRLECHFGLFSHYGYLARHPEFSKEFRGREFILQELDNIEMIHAEFNAMIEEGMKMSMEDMEDLMEEMRGKIREFRKDRGIRDPFDEMSKDF